MFESQPFKVCMAAAMLSLLPSVVCSSEPAPPPRKPDLSGFVQLTRDKKQFGAAHNFMAFARGRWEGDGVPYKNNLALISCEKEQMRCLITEVQQIGPQEIGTIIPATEMKIRRWSEETLSADFQEVGPFVCDHMSVTLHIQAKAAELVFNPINTAQKWCKIQNLHRQIWRIVDPLDH